MDSFNPSPGLSIWEDVYRKTPQGLMQLKEVTIGQKEHPRFKLQSLMVQRQGPAGLLFALRSPAAIPRLCKITSSPISGQMLQFGHTRLRGGETKMLRLAFVLLFASSATALAGTATANFQVGLIITEKHAASNLNPKPRDSRLTGERALRPSRSIATKPIAQTR